MGPPGIGKSTIFRAACNARNSLEPEFYRREEIRRRNPNSGLWAEFGDFIERVYARLPAEHIHQRRLVVTRSALSRARKMEGAPGGALALVDQGLCQRGLSLWLSCSGSVVAETYFEIMPVPAAVFHFVADAEIVRSRNAARAVGGGADRSNDVEACYTASLAAVAALKRRGVAVIDIDAECPVGENVRHIFDAVRALR